MKFIATYVQLQWGGNKGTSSPVVLAAIRYPENKSLGNNYASGMSEPTAVIKYSYTHEYKNGQRKFFGYMFRFMHTLILKG